MTIFAFCLVILTICMASAQPPQGPPPQGPPPGGEKYVKVPMQICSRCVVISHLDVAHLLSVAGGGGGAMAGGGTGETSVTDAGCKAYVGPLLLHFDPCLSP